MNYSSKSLAVKYRPATFREVVAQNTITDILENQIKTKTFRNVVLFTGPAGCGKAQPMYSKLLTPNGYIHMRDVKVGDTLITRKGDYTKVTDIFPQGVRPIYEITLQDKTKIRVADNHLNSVYVYNQDKHERQDFVLNTMDLMEFVKNSRWKVRIDTPSVEFDKQDILIDPYLLGVLIGDGRLFGNFGISNSEDDIIQKVNDILNKQYGMYLKYSRNYDYGMHYITKTNHNGTKGNKGQYPVKYNYDVMKTLKGHLNYYGLLCKSTDKHIPKEYLYNTKEVRIKLLQGLYDSDGYTAKNGETSFSTSSKQLSEDFAFLVRSLGIRDTIKSHVSHYTNKQGERITCKVAYSHYLHIPNKLEYCTSKKHLQRRSVKQNEPLRNILSIEYIGDEECQCIMVDNKDHTYISDDFIPTHNTTCARAFASLLNGGKGKPIEIDAASNNSVDNVRDIITKAQQKSIDSDYKVFIIDECHSISSAGWQAFLKLIEEPPINTVFIFCTTDPQKIPATILSRVQRFEFKRIPFEKIVERLKYILENENITDYEDSAIQFIAKAAAGGMRDAITSLDKCIAFSDKLTLESVVKALGSVDYKVYFNLTNAIIDYKEKEVIDIIENIYREGSDIKLFVKNYTAFLLDVCKYCICEDFEYVQIPDTYKEDMEYLISEKDFLKYLLSEINTLNSDIKWEASPKSIVELKLLNLTQPENAK